MVSESVLDKAYAQEALRAIREKVRGQYWHLENAFSSQDEETKTFRAVEDNLRREMDEKVAEIRKAYGERIERASKAVNAAKEKNGPKYERAYNAAQTFFGAWVLQQYQRNPEVLGLGDGALCDAFAKAWMDGWRPTVGQTMKAVQKRKA